MPLNPMTLLEEGEADDRRGDHPSNLQRMRVILGPLSILKRFDSTLLVGDRTKRLSFLRVRRKSCSRIDR